MNEVSLLVAPSDFEKDLGYKNDPQNKMSSLLVNIFISSHQNSRFRTTQKLNPLCIDPGFMVEHWSNTVSVSAPTQSLPVLLTDRSVGHSCSCCCLSVRQS